MSDFNLSLGRKGKAGEFDSTDLKAGTKKTDLENDAAKNIFDAFDNDKDGELNGIEVEKLLAQLKDAAKNDNLSKREAKKLLKLEGLKGMKSEQLFNFLKEIAAVEVEEEYSAYQDGSMGLELSASQTEPAQEVEDSDAPLPPAQEGNEDEPIDNTKAYYDNGRILTLGDDGKSILVQENENAEPVKLQVDEEGNIISYAKNGESFQMTAKRLGLPTEGSVFERFKELNEKAAKKGYFLVGGKVKIPSEALENLALDKVNVNPDNEIAAYVKFMANKKSEQETNNTESQPLADSTELSDEEFRKKYPYIARPDENTPEYEPPKFEIPEPFTPVLPPAAPTTPPVEKPEGDKPVTEAPTTPVTPPPAKAEGTTEAGNPKQLKVTIEDFSIENLRKRYPEDKYEESSKGEGITYFIDKETNKTAFILTEMDTKKCGIIYRDGKPSVALSIDKNDGSAVRNMYKDNEIISRAYYYADSKKLCGEIFFNPDGTEAKSLSYNDNGNITEEKITRSSKPNDYIKNTYEDNGTKIFSYDGLTEKYDCPIADELKNLIYAKNSLGLPVSKDEEIKELVLGKLNSENIALISQAYEKNTGKSLSTDLADEWAISESDMKEIKAHIEKCFGEKEGYKPEFKNDNSQVDNKYYKGEPYSVVQNGNIITATNTKTNEKYEVNLDKLFENVSPDKKAALLKIIQTLPGEVIADLSIEADSINYAPPKGTIFGFYQPGKDEITTTTHKETLVHELRHALDYNGYIFNTSSIGGSDAFEKAYNEEMKNYLAAGNQRWSEEKGHSLEGGYNYCTKNEKEMFAEIYTFLMLGKNQSQQVIEKYFPKTLEAVKNHIAAVREEYTYKRKSVI